MAAALVLSPFILVAVYPRVARGKMLYKDVMPELKPSPRSRSLLGLAILIVGRGRRMDFRESSFDGLLDSTISPGMDGCCAI